MDIETLGELVDKAENYVQYGAIEGEPMATLPPRMRIEALTRGLIEIRDAIRAAYVEGAGNDPWASDPFFSRMPEGSES